MRTPTLVSTKLVVNTPLLTGQALTLGTIWHSDVFYLFFFTVIQGGLARIRGDEFQHMTKVLRLSTNDRYPGLDFMALEDPKLIAPPSIHWHVFAAFGEFHKSDYNTLTY